MKDEKRYFVYMMANWNGSVLYCGVTNDLKRRAWEHRTKIYPGFTATYNVNRLVYYEVYEEVLNAIAREKQIKGGSRHKKVLMINRFNPKWMDLYSRI